MSEQIPRLALWGKHIVDTALRKITDWPAEAAENIVRGAFGLVPESETSTRQSSSDPYTETPQPVRQQSKAAQHSRFVDAEEISWLESHRHELPYRRDTLWAVPQMWWEMSFGEVGAGAYIAGATTGNKPAMAAGWAISTVFKGALLLADLGRPERLLHVFVKPGTSWIARGSWAYAGFTLAGGASLLPLPHGLQRIATATAVACASVVGTYDGCFLQHSKAVSSWTDPAIPALFAVNGMGGGVHLANAVASDARLRPVSALASLLSTGLGAWYAKNLSQRNTAARLSARDLLEGIQRDRFVLLGLGLGGIGAGALSLLSSRLPRIAAASFAALGVVSIRRAILQAGVHAPVMDPPRQGINPIDHVSVSKGVPDGRTVISHE